ncbi:protein DpdD [Aetokthonos hydrillicola]|uniref:protein DpdD n=1 Tax=Aetokthonos hydrillicola TaxID=1550245 RepID=UPI001ABB5CCE
MMNSPTDAEIRHFLNHFFGSGNKFKLNQIQQDGSTQVKIRPWVELLTQGEPQSTVLPCWHNDTVDWYGLTFSERQLRRLSEELMAFVGPTYSTFRGQRVQLNLQDPIELAVYEFTKGNAIKLLGQPPKVWEGLERMRKVRGRQGKYIGENPRPTGRVLRDFYMALQAGDRNSAEQSLQYLIDQHRLDALNLLFLRVQLLAELQRWNELLALPELGNLLQVRRPFAVTQALLIAVYCTELQQFEDKKAPKSAVTYFKEVLFQRYNNLFAVRAGSKIPEVLKLFMLLAVGGEPPRPFLRDELLAILDVEDNHRSYLQKLAELLPDSQPPREGNVVQEAEQLSKNGDFDQAFSLLCDAPPSKEKVRLLLQCAYELQTLAAEKAALQAFDELSVDDQNVLIKIRWNQAYLTQLWGSQQGTTKDTTAAETIPVNWLEWLLKLDKEPSWERALHTARQGSTEWDVSILLTQPRAVVEFGELLDKVGSKAESVLHNALPYLLAFFQKDEEFPRGEFLTLYHSLLELLVLSTEGGDADLVLFNDLAIALFKLGLDATKYIEILDYALELWKRFAAPKKVDWALDLLDVLILYPCAVDQKRSQFVFAVAETLRRHANRIDEEQWGIFRSLIQDLNLEQTLPDLLGEELNLVTPSFEDEENIFQKLKGKSVLIYNLTETAAIRVKNVLEAGCQEVKVYLSHDKGGNERLRQWVINSDLVVIVTASAKHAATDFIEANRPSHLPAILLVNSKGSTGMLRAIRQHLGTV